MKIISKVMLILAVLMTTMVIIPQTRVAAADVEVMPGVTVNANTEAADETTVSSMRNVVNRVLGFLQIASALLAVVVIAATGFRYIMETPDMKNELKKSMIPIIVGILLVFFAASVARFFVGMFQD